MPIRLRSPIVVTSPRMVFLVLVSALSLLPARPLAAVVRPVCGTCTYLTVQAANDAAAPGDVIRILDSQHVESGVVIDESLIVEGLGREATVFAGATLRANATEIILSTAPGTVVTVRKMTLRHGKGAIFNEGELTVEDVLIEDNSAQVGAGILNNTGGVLLLARSELSNNEAVYHGGGLLNQGEAELDDVTVIGNRVVLDAGLLGAGAHGGGISNNGTLRVKGSLIEGNRLELDGASGPDLHMASGAGLYSAGSLTLTDSEVRENDVVGDFDTVAGGGVQVAGQAFVSRSRIRQNALPFGSGGGIHSSVAALTVEDTEISANSASQGGGIQLFATPTVRITRSAVTGNGANEGGGIWTCGSGSLQLANVTVSGNLANDHGGGIYVCSTGSLELANVTVAHNHADADDDDLGSGGGLHLQTSGEDSPTIALRNSMIVNNTAFSALYYSAPDCDGTLISDGYNIIGSLGNTLGGTPCKTVGSSNGLQTGIVVSLDPLAAYGGLTPSHRIPSNSPAHNAGNPGGCLDYDGLELGVDQRYAERQGICEVGAFERGGSPAIFFDGFESGTSLAWSSASP